MFEYLILCSLIFIKCYANCDPDHIMLNGSNWKDSKLYKAFAAKNKFDYDFSYHNFTEIIAELNKVNRNNSTITELFSLGKTSESRDIPAIIISKGHRNRSTVVFECGIHSREWISVAFCLWTINKLVKQNETLVDKFRFLIIPVLNPDGYVFTWETDRFWRKSRSYFVDNTCRGTDLNRNWDTPNFCRLNSANDPCNETSCGGMPFTSPETKALSDYLIGNRDHLLAYFSIHSYSQLWMYPWSYKSESVPNKVELESLSTMAVSAIRGMYGTKYKHGPLNQKLYPVSGASIDWVYDTLGVKYTFAIELRDEGQTGFLLPCHLIKPTSEETWAGIETVLNYLHENNFKNMNSDEQDRFGHYNCYDCYENNSYSEKMPLILTMIISIYAVLSIH